MADEEKKKAKKGTEEEKKTKVIKPSASGVKSVKKEPVKKVAVDKKIVKAKPKAK